MLILELVFHFIWYCLYCAFVFLPLATLSVLVTATCCNAMLFIGNPDPLSLTLGGPVVPLICGFLRQDNLLVWRELFMNLYQLKSHV